MTENVSTAIRAAQPRSRTRDLALAGLFAALLSAAAWISIPLPFTAVPLTLQVFVVVLAALLLRPSMAALSVGTYLLLGAAGVPVFAGGKSGLGAIAGPTGGFLLGFLMGAFLGSLLREYLEARGAKQLVSDFSAAALTIAVVYLLGWIQLMLITGMAPVPAAAAGVLPFIAADVIKAAVAVGVAQAIRRSGVI